MTLAGVLMQSAYYGVLSVCAIVVNPRRACAARVTVVVRVSVSTTILALQATRRLMSDTNSFSGIYMG